MLGIIDQLARIHRPAPPSSHAKQPNPITLWDGTEAEVTPAKPNPRPIQLWTGLAPGEMLEKKQRVWSRTNMNDLIRAHFGGEFFTLNQFIKKIDLGITRVGVFHRLTTMAKEGELICKWPAKKSIPHQFKSKG